MPYEGEAGEASRTAGILPVEIDGEVVVFTIEANRAVAVRRRSGRPAQAERAHLAARAGLRQHGRAGLRRAGRLRPRCRSARSCSTRSSACTSPSAAATISAASVGPGGLLLRRRRSSTSTASTSRRRSRASRCILVRPPLSRRRRGNASWPSGRCRIF
ncbi:MAG: hypothetical protein MZV70_66510 [Desulfobacterales bacterium]|nr:hypothetical protein [Desulfobacterales bacterium]